MKRPNAMFAIEKFTSKDIGRGKEFTYRISIVEGIPNGYVKIQSRDRNSTRSPEKVIRPADHARDGWRYGTPANASAIQIAIQK